MKCSGEKKNVGEHTDKHVVLAVVADSDDVFVARAVYFESSTKPLMAGVECRADCLKESLRGLLTKANGDALSLESIARLCFLTGIGMGWGYMYWTPD